MAKAETMFTPRRAYSKWCTGARGAYEGFRTDFAVTRYPMSFSVLIAMQKISKTLKGRYREKH